MNAYPVEDHRHKQFVERLKNRIKELEDKLIIASKRIAELEEDYYIENEHLDV